MDELQSLYEEKMRDQEFQDFRDLSQMELDSDFGEDIRTMTPSKQNDINEVQSEGGPKSGDFSIPIVGGFRDDLRSQTERDPPGFTPRRPEEVSDMTGFMSKGTFSAQIQKPDFDEQSLKLSSQSSLQGLTDPPEHQSAQSEPQTEDKSPEEPQLVPIRIDFVDQRLPVIDETKAGKSAQWKYMEQERLKAHRLAKNKQPLKLLTCLNLMNVRQFSLQKTFLTFENWLEDSKTV